MPVIIAIHIDVMHFAFLTFKIEFGFLKIMGHLFRHILLKSLLCIKPPLVFLQCYCLIQTHVTAQKFLVPNYRSSIARDFCE